MMFYTMELVFAIEDLKKIHNSGVSIYDSNGIPFMGKWKLRK